MPRFRAKHDAFVPDGVIGPTIVYEADYITVSGGEANILRADPDTWEDMDALVIAEAQAEAEVEAKQVTPDTKKVISSAPKTKGIVTDDAATECSKCDD